ncbi:MAG: hypothetical protein R3F14_17025 [Polyangiaceae bacterium]
MLQVIDEEVCGCLDLVFSASGGLVISRGRPRTGAEEVSPLKGELGDLAGVADEENTGWRGSCALAAEGSKRSLRFWPQPDIDFSSPKEA